MQAISMTACMHIFQHPIHGLNETLTQPKPKTHVLTHNMFI